MRLVSFDALRTLGMPGVRYFKPEEMFREKTLLSEETDWILFPEYWQINALTYGLGAKIFPSPASYHLGHNKIEQTRLFEMICPTNTPLTLIRPNTPSSRDEILEIFDFPFVAKEPKNSMGRGVFLIEKLSDFDEYCAAAEVLYIQELLPIDRDMRVVLIGDQVIGGYWRVGEGFHNNVAQGGKVIHGVIPDNARTLIEQIAAQTGINHAGFDIAMVGDHPYLLEFNRLFGNHGIKQLGVDINQLILDYLNRQSTPPIDPPLLEVVV